MSRGEDTLPVAIVAESDDETRMLMRSLLELLGFVVVEAVSADDLYESTVFYQPELIVIELTQPVITRFSAIRRIKRKAELRRIPIIAISSSDRATNAQLALAAGCAAHLHKPVEFDQLEDVVESLAPSERLCVVSMMVH